MSLSTQNIELLLQYSPRLLFSVCLFSLIAIWICSKTFPSFRRIQFVGLNRTEYDRHKAKFRFVAIMLVLSGGFAYGCYHYNVSNETSSFMGHILYNISEATVNLIDMLGTAEQSADSLARKIYEMVDVVHHLQECVTMECITELKTKVEPFFAYFIDVSQEMYELGPENNGTKRLYEATSEFTNAIRDFNVSGQENAHLVPLFRNFLLSMTYHHLPKQYAQRYNVSSVTFSDLVEIAAMARQVNKQVKKAFAQGTDIMKTMNHYSFAAGVGAFRSELFKNISGWGVSANIFSFFICFLGPNITGLFNLFGFVATHYAYDSRSWVNNNGVYVFEYNGLTVARFVFNLFFGRGIIYFVHLYKVYLMGLFASQMSLSGGIAAKLLNKYQKSLENQGQYQTWIFYIISLFIQILKAPRIIVGYFVIVFTVTNLIAASASLIWEFVAYCYDLLTVEIGFGVAEYAITGIATFFYTAGPILDNLFGTFGLDSYIPSLPSTWGQAQVVSFFGSFKDFLPEETMINGSLKAFSSHLTAHRNPILFQGAFFLLQGLISYFKRRYQLQTKEPANVRAKSLISRGIVNATTIAFNVIVKKAQFFTLLQASIQAFGWIQPFLPIVLEPIFNTFFNQAGSIGRSNLINSGVSYLWDWCDAYTLPTTIFRNLA